MKYKISQDKDLVPVLIYYFVLIMGLIGGLNEVEGIKSGIFWLVVIPLIIFLITKNVSLKDRLENGE